jgi:hypothetical protein
MRKFLMLVFLIFSTPLTFAGEQAPRIGVVYIHSNYANKSSPQYACATFQGQMLSPGQGVHIAVFRKPHWIKGKVTKKIETTCDTRDPMEGVAYEVQLEKNRTLFFETGIAVVADDVKRNIENGRPVLFASTDGLPIVFHKCTSYEGVHLYAWQGSKRIWHEYFNLFYDVDPTCSKEESEEN